MAPAPAIADEVRSFVSDNWEFFARWDNGEAEPEELAWLEGRNCDDWTLINGRLPGYSARLDGFRSVFESMHGRFADDPVTPRIDFLVVGELAADVYLTTYVQHYDFESGKSTSRLISVVLVREHGSLRAQFVHE